MYHEEKVIHGVLRWRSTPTGVWWTYTPEELTKMLIKEREKNDSNQRQSACGTNP